MLGYLAPTTPVAKNRAAGITASINNTAWSQ